MRAGRAAGFTGNRRFELLSQIGEGGMGAVYAVYDRELDTKVALKTLPRLDAHSASSVLRFKNEFRALQDIQHPNLVALGELFEEEGLWFFTMELVEGVDFLAYVQPNGTTTADDEAGAAVTAKHSSSGNPHAGETPYEPTAPAWAGPRKSLRMPAFDEARVRETMRQLVGALAYLHSGGLVHRDVKPSNILVTDKGRVILLDFGLVGDIAPEGPHITDDSVLGTAHYMAPEQAASPRVGPPADWYSVGVVLYEALTGDLPFKGNAITVLVNKQKEEPPPPNSFVAGIPDDLNALCVELLRRDPAARPTAPRIFEVLGMDPSKAHRFQSGASGAGGAPFVGRDRELAALTRSFHEVALGGARVVLVHGESGVGKSALVRQLRDQIGAEVPKLTTLVGRCHERESVPYKAFDRVADALANHLAQLPTKEVKALLPPRAALLAQVFPPMRRVEALARLTSAPEEARDPQEQRTRLFVALRELLTALAKRTPLLIVIDDLQWADADSLALLNKIMAPPDPPRLLLLGTVRTASGQIAGEATTAWDGVFASAYHLQIAPLTPEDSRELAVRWMERLGAAGAMDVESIAREASGHPLFIAELVRHTMSSATSRAAAAPALLEDAIWGRVQQLDPIARSLLELVVIAGHPVSRRVLTQASSAESNELARAFAALRLENLIRTTKTRTQEAVEPYHDKVRLAVMAHVDANVLRGSHEQLAVALEAGSGGDSEALAVHWRDAGDAKKAAHYFAQAGTDAVEALAFDRAARLFRLSLGLGEVTPVEERQRRRRLADALASSGSGVEAAAEYRKAALGANAKDAIDCTRLAAEQLLISGHIDEGRACIATVLSSVGMKLAPTPRSALVSLLLRRAQLRLRGLKFREKDSSQVAESELALIDICWSVSVGLSIVDTIRGADYQTRSLLLALRAGEPYRIARATAMETGFSATAGGPARRRTEQIANAADALAARLDHPHVAGLTVLTKGFAAWLTGRWREGYELCNRAEQILRDRCAGVTWELTSAQLFWMGALLYLGDVRELAARRPQLLQQARERGNLYAETNLRARFTDLTLLCEDRPAEARAEITEALARWTPEGFHLQHYYALNAIAQVDLYEGMTVDAYDRIVAGVDNVTTSLLSRVQVLRIESFFMRARAALALAAAGHEKVELLRATRRDARRIAKEKMAWSDPISRLLSAGASAVEGDRDAAVAELDAAARGFESADMALFLAITRRSLGKLRAGDEGQALIAESEAWLSEHGVRDAVRLSAVFAPGLPG